MDVHFKPEVQAKLDQMARDNGQPAERMSLPSPPGTR